MRRPSSGMHGLLALFVAIVFFAQPVRAHTVTVYAWVDAEHGTIQGEVFVPGGEPVVGAKVEAFAPNGQVVATRETNAKGEFLIPFKSPVAHHILASTGDGHQANYTVPASEFPNASVGSAAQSAADHSHDTESSHTHASPIENRLDALDSQIVALRRELAQSKDDARLKDILAAVGYILGIMGISLYFLARKAKRSS